MKATRLSILCIALVAAPALSQAPGPDATGPRPPARPTYGTSHLSYYAVDANEFQPISSLYTYHCTGSPCTLKYATNEFTGYAFQATVHLPAGALVSYIELDYFDEEPAGQVFAKFDECDYVGLNCQAPQSPACPGINATVCSAIGEASGEGGNALDLPIPLTIDNIGHRYVLQAGTSTGNGGTAIGRVLIGYQLQVSPPTPVALFNDVPTDHPFFQFIGALAASGITAGCGNGNFCPDNPLTRGQMAVFLAKALGLQWQ